ncbi:MAG: nucleoside triphosphate pyrophosphohydrolase [Alphaproteobacteria bacterium]|nr:nucleoside triphosphate pyrophosphohydrolase [Alphaproteobacteria bacterium]
MTDSKNHPIEKLIEVMAALRNPEGGCPWDLEQDFATIAPYTLEEAYEVADAIDRGDMVALREELGDLLLQPVYHAQMAAEGGLFDIHDVITDITDKMIHRHPHVFGNANASSPEDVNAIWDERKKLEKNTAQDNNVEPSALDGVTKGLPALLRAQKLQKKASKAGFAWAHIGQVIDKLEEELAELREAIERGNHDEQAEELGDVLFVLATLGRWLDINAEESLRQCNAKFERRFKGMEGDFKAKNKSLSTASLEEMLAAWDAQKSLEKG